MKKFFTSLFIRYQTWRDKRFLKRLERVLSNNVIKSSIFLNGNIYSSGSITMYMDAPLLKDTIENERGTKRS